MDIKKSVGQKIQELRKKKRLTQENLAEVLGIETVSLSKIERGKSYPTSENLAKLAVLLEVEPYEFFLLSNIPNKDELLKSINASLAEISDDEKKLIIVDSFLKSLLK